MTAEPTSRRAAWIPWARFVLFLASVVAFDPARRQWGWLVAIAGAVAVWGALELMSWFRRRTK